MNDSSSVGCLVCGRDRHAVPLVVEEYRDDELRICPQQLPLLIHGPHKLAEVLPGAEHFEAGSP